MNSIPDGLVQIVGDFNYGVSNGAQITQIHNGPMRYNIEIFEEEQLVYSSSGSATSTAVEDELIAAANDIKLRREQQRLYASGFFAQQTEDSCRVYWGSHGCYRPKGHDGHCACDCCPDLEAHDGGTEHLIHDNVRCVATTPFYGPETKFYGEDVKARGLLTFKTDKDEDDE